MKHCQIIYGRVTVFDGVIQELNVFVWELEPLDDQTRSVREWVEEYIREDVGLLSTTQAPGILMKVQILC